MKAFWKHHWKLLLGLGAVLLFAGAWLLIWHRVGRQVEQAAYKSVYDTLTFDGAYYQKCSQETVRDYVPEAEEIGEALCGSELGVLQFPSETGTVECPLYACKPLEDAEKERGIVLLKGQDGYMAYELSGFRYLDESPSVWAVCASYGIGKAADIESLTVKDADGNVLETVTDSKALSDFFDKLVKLGDCLTDEDLAQIYYDVYTAEFGDDGVLTLKDGRLKARDDDSFAAAADFWNRDVKLVTIRLKNGLLMRDCMYMPVPGVFAVYGNYRVTEPFFADEKT
ncbi:MAG: hypothetical protein IKX57_04100 [Oscillospiraceae bacterium]|nr:hypothetical protein [Oscillospiraceae bacterium]